jgi:capsular exopolysaccharide synthesis family protein
MANDQETSTAATRDEVSIAEIGRIVHTQRWLVASVLAASVAMAVAFTALQSPAYESAATIQMHQAVDLRTQLGDLGAAARLIGLERPAEAGIGTDMVVMQSRRIIESVVESLSLHVRLTDPERPRSAILSQVAAPREASPVTLHLRRAADGAYTVRLETAAGETVDLPDRVDVGVVTQIGDVTLALRADADVPDRMTLEVVPFRDAVHSVQDALNVSRPQLDAQVVAVRYRSGDPVLAAAVPNAVAEGFIAYRNENARSEKRTRAAFLREQVERYRHELVLAEERVQRFRERENVISIGEQSSQQVQRLADLQKRRDELQEEIAALRRLMATVGGESSGDDPRDEYRLLASFPVFFANPAIQDILRSLIDLENDRARLLVRRTEQSIDVQGIDQRIGELELQLLRTAGSYLQSRESQLASVEATIAMTADRMEGIPATEVDFARLLRQQQLLSDIHGALEVRLREAEVDEVVEPLTVQMLDPALVPETRVAPRPVLNLVLGILLGGAFGVLAAFGRHGLDRRVRSRADVRTASGLPILGMIPRIEGGAAPRLAGLGSGGLLTLVRRPSKLGAGPRIVSLSAPSSAAAEAYRALRTRLSISNGAAPPTVLAVCSVLPGEGKSTTAANLAISYAQQGIPTLLIDADLRKGTLHTAFGFPPAAGLADVLQGRVPVDGALTDSAGLPDSLHLLASGSRTDNPTELLASEAMSELLAMVGSGYGRVVIDTPPLSVCTDAMVIVTRPGVSLLLVARMGLTDRATIEEVSREFRALGITARGVVVNDPASNGVNYYTSSR